MKSQSKKKYSKYLTGVASAALVASAVAPVVSAADFNDVVDTNSHKEAIDALAAEGVINGYPDGSFKPNKTLTRSDVVKLMGKWLVSKGYSIPTDYKTNPRFTDLTSKSNDDLLQSAAIVKDNDVFRGYEDGSLGAAGSITRENMAVVLVRAYDSVNKTNLLTYVQEQEFDRDVVDLNKAKAEARTAIDVLDFFDITNPAAPNFRPKETTTRGQFASFLYKTIQVEVPGTEEPEAPEVSEITSVTATGEKELELVGKNLHTLKAEQLKIEGNELASFKANADGTKATIELKNELTSGKEMILNLTTKSEVEGEDDVVTPFKFTYEFSVEKVVGTTTQVDANKKDQMLQFTIDGQPANLDKLTAAGYTVKFQSTDPTVLLNTSTGTLNSLVNGKEFSYQVVVTHKDGKKFESAVTEVKVIDFKTAIKTIDEVEVMQGDVKVENGKLSLEDGATTVTIEKATTLSGATIKPTGATFTSSNPSVATISSNGTITPISTGSVTIVAKVNNVTKEIPMTVSAGKRVATTATLAKSNIKVLKDTPDTLEATVKDQYGDVAKGTLTVESKDQAISTAEVTEFKDGKAKISVTGVKEGTTTIHLKAGDTVLGNINVSVSEDKKVATTKFEAESTSDDLTIDAIKGSKDGAVKLALKQYNSDGYYIGNADISSNYTVVSSNSKVASAVKDSDNKAVTVTAGKETGTTEIMLKEGDITRASATVTVKNSTPIISAVKFEESASITKKGDFTAPVLKAEGITLTSTEFKPLIDKDGYIFIENEDINVVLGSIGKSYSGDSSDITKDLSIVGGDLTGAVDAGAKGTIVVSVKNENQSTPVGTKTIEVNVPAAN